MGYLVLQGNVLVIFFYLMNLKKTKTSQIPRGGKLNPNGGGGKLNPNGGGGAN